MGHDGWIQANSATRANPELHPQGAAHRQLTHRAIGSLIARIELVAIGAVASALGGG